MNNLSATDIGIIASKIDTGWETAFSDYLTRLVSPTSHLFYPNLKEHLVQLHRCCSDLNVRVNLPRELIIYIYIYILYRLIMEFLFISNIKFLLPNFDLRKGEICSLNDNKVQIIYKLFVHGTFIFIQRKKCKKVL